ncbi:hypothetical protein KM043_006215 [Ampulex compressa]|nr:hypothetical protein KM043_006215 [Ampulex compressa]
MLDAKSEIFFATLENNGPPSLGLFASFVLLFRVIVERAVLDSVDTIPGREDSVSKNKLRLGLFLRSFRFGFRMGSTQEPAEQRASFYGAFQKTTDELTSPELPLENMAPFSSVVGSDPE